MNNETAHRIVLPLFVPTLPQPIYRRVKYAPGNTPVRIRPCFNLENVVCDVKRFFMLIEAAIAAHNDLPSDFRSRTLDNLVHVELHDFISKLDNEGYLGSQDFALL